jgi:hypothetical protein
LFHQGLRYRDIVSTSRKKGRVRHRETFSKRRAWSQLSNLLVLVVVVVLVQGLGRFAGMDEGWMEMAID